MRAMLALELFPSSNFNSFGRILLNVLLKELFSVKKNRGPEEPFKMNRAKTPLCRGEASIKVMVLDR